MKEDNQKGEEEDNNNRGEPEFNLNDLLANKPLEDSTFSNFLYANYLAFFQDIDEIQKVAEDLSLSDTFASRSFVKNIFFSSFSVLLKCYLLGRNMGHCLLMFQKSLHVRLCIITPIQLHTNFKV